MFVEAYATLPDTITVRELAVAGRVYVASLLDPKTYRKQELASLYKDRWTSVPSKPIWAWTGCVAKALTW